MRLDFTRSFDGECSFERDAGGFAGREMSRWRVFARDG